ncbi:MarR family winged helix-turn-helix transcriptional regulator [Flexibacterium corallicola]|uniref:MarR family winged helix-turn-helix transcriptional regulator n=1 Tax=Flexibacterium corallicola TaxID=3037259 RepID=UPI00286F49FA|nr:MarR family transcriptional regulator [Pseudovibrio sp. M1P-2-3]
MYFLKELPTRMMIDRYVAQTGVGSTDDIEQALSMMRSASELGRLLDTYFSAHQLSQLKFLVLVVIDREPETDSLRQSEINQRLDVSKPVLHRTISSMLSAGLLVRSEDKEDSRAHRLALTDAGKQSLNAILPGYFQVISKFMERRT